MKFSSLFRRKNILIYTALSDDECMKIKGRLLDAGIFHWTKTRGIYATSSRNIGWGRKQSQYDIYVKVEDEYKANEAIYAR